MKTSIFDFSDISSRDITLRFKLEPVIINSKGEAEYPKKDPYQTFLPADEKLHTQYETLKVAIDAYHRMYIDKKLKYILNMPSTAKDENGEEKDTDKKSFVESCVDFIESAGMEREKNTEEKNKKMSAMRTFISNVLKQDNDSSLSLHKNMNKAGFIKKTLREWLEQMEDGDNKEWDASKVLDIIKNDGEKQFVNCEGLLEARQRMYEKNGKSMSVPYRCINRNLPRFSKDYHLFHKIKEEHPEVFDFAKLDADFSEELKALSDLSGRVIDSIGKVFQPELYPIYMNQDGINCLNTIIGKKKEKGSSTMGLNQYINEYNQETGKKKKNGIPTFDKLNNQILFGKGEFLETLQEHKDAKPIIKEIVASLGKLNAFDGRTEKNRFYGLLQGIESYTNKVYVSTKVVSNISASLWGDYSLLNDLVKHDKNGKLIQKSITLGELNEGIEKLQLEGELNAFDYFKQSKVKSVVNEKQYVDLFEQLRQSYQKYCDAHILSCNTFTEERVLVIERLFDSILSLQRFFKAFSPSLYEVDVDGLFVKAFHDCWDKISDFDKHYDLLRNLFTRKPFNMEKIRVHFGMSNVMNGFVDCYTDTTDKGTQYNGYILRKKHLYRDDGLSEESQTFQQYEYYLVVSNKVKLFRERGNAAICEQKRGSLIEENRFSGFERFDYYQSSINNFKKAFKRLIGIERDSSVDGIRKDKNNDELKRQYIKRLMETCRSMERVTPLQRLATKEKDFLDSLDYESLDKKIDNILNASRERKYIPISIDDMKNLMKSSKNKQGKETNTTFMFKITNKDLSFSETMADGRRKSHGTENLHTMYFRALLDVDQNTFDIGKGSVFFRKATDKRKMKYNKNNPTHRKGTEIDFKNPYNNGKKKSVFNYDLIKDKRYTEDSYLFHLSITQNFQCKGETINLNEEVREYLKNQNDLRIIGIDRGERNLLYATMIDLEGNICEQKSFNVVGYSGVSADGETFQTETDYHKLLQTKADKMRHQQKEWKEVDKIKDIKDGYLSVAVHELAKMMVENNAIIVMEDLNPGFMSNRQSQLANVYQKFEDKLRNKLQFYVDKHKGHNEPSGLYHALQLAGKETKDNQNGFIFYVPAWNTSKVDPATGFVNMFTLKYTNKEVAKIFFNAFNSISKDDETGHYKFSFNYSRMARIKAAKYIRGTRDDWTISTHGSRIVKEQKGDYWEYREVPSLTSEYDELFKKHGIATDADLQKHIDKCNDASFFRELIKLWNWTLQLRNYDDKGNDYIISPVLYNDKDYYCSKDYEEGKQSNKSKDSIIMPKDADANGAFNIARKGLILYERIRNGNTNNKINNSEWLSEVQKVRPNRYDRASY